MARRYARDNRGRFASTGTGATGRGAGLKTAAGNKRASVQISGAKAGGRIAKPAGYQPGSTKATPKPAAAPKRLKFDINYHGTSAAAASAIKKGGWKESIDNALKGPGVYLTRDKREARAYAHNAIRRGQEPGMVKVRVAKNSKRVDVLPTDRRHINEIRKNPVRNINEVLKRRAQGKGLYMPNTGDRVTVMPAALADRMTVRSVGRVSKPRRRR